MAGGPRAGGPVFAGPARGWRSRKWRPRSWRFRSWKSRSQSFRARGWRGLGGGYLGALGWWIWLGWPCHPWKWGREKPQQAMNASNALFTIFCPFAIFGGCVEHLLSLLPIFLHVAGWMTPDAWCWKVPKVPKVNKFTKSQKSLESPESPQSPCLVN